MEAPKIPSIVKLTRNRRFSYKPRYYDRRKEDLQERTERIRRELESEGATETEKAHLSFDKYRSSHRRHAVRTSNYRILLLALLLALLAYYLLIN